MTEPIDNKTTDPMAYSDFTLTSFEKRYGIPYQIGPVFPKPQTPKIPSETLVKQLNRNNTLLPLLSEKAKSEFIIAPILQEIFNDNTERFTIFSGFAFDVDAELNGFCDYLFSSRPHSITIKAPIFCLVEAKNRTVEEGLGQCAAEMLAARMFNQANDEQLNAVYGSVTTGFEWVFLRLDETGMQIDLDRFYLNELPQLLGVLQAVVDASVPLV